MVYLKRFVQWQNYVHYIALGIFLMLYSIPVMFVLEKFLIIWDFVFWLAFTLFVIIGLFIIDSLVHLIFYILPKPFRWED